MLQLLLPPEWNLNEHLAIAMPNLTPSGPNRPLRAYAQHLQPVLTAKFPDSSPKDLECLNAGLWLLADDLGTAHEICQGIATPYGSAWHAVMHRREGDFSNSLYWWHRARGIRWADPIEGVSLCQCIRHTANVAGALQSDRWIHADHYDPAEFVRQAQAHPGSSQLVQIQRFEWLSLMTQCFHNLRRPASRHA